MNRQLGPLTVERRLIARRWLSLAVPLASLVLAAIIAGIVLAATGHNPFSTYRQMFDASITASGGLSSTFVYATPMLFTGLCAAFAFRMRTWNIGGEGQLYMGAIGAAAAGLALGDWPRPLLVLAMILAGLVAGAIWAAIPGVLRAYFRTNEILVSLMLNYAAGLLMYYLIYDSTSYWRDLSTPSAKVFPTGKTLGVAANWPVFNIGSFVLPFGFVLGAVLAAAMWATIRYSRYGFEMRVIADAPAAAAYAGMRTRRKIVSVMVVSGCVAGLAGASQIGDFSHVLDPRGLQQAGYGYTGIVVGALALYNPLAVIVVSLFIGALTNAGNALQGPHFPAGLVGTMQGIILFSVLGGEILARYRFGLARRGRSASLPSSTGADAAAITHAPPTEVVG
ncbi:MAG TPA: ABC transporter permease [Acidimicrobiales bacterium]|nr:ABC transporter permease [Acidimicrobiales bacterium]